MSLSASAWVRYGLVALLGVALAQACSSADDAGPGILNPSGGQEGSAGEGGHNVIVPTVPPAEEPPPPGMSPLCGVGDCSPDQADSCADHVPPTTAEQSIGVGDGGAGGAAGWGGWSGGEASGSGGQPDGGAEGGSAAGGASGQDGAGGTLSGPSQYACRIVPAARRRRAECAAAGNGDLDDPCFSSADCQASLACVTERAIGRCRPFCCAGETVCDGFPGTYCAERGLHDASEPSASPLAVPVCVAAQNCRLDEPPCAREGECECALPTACLVVRSDGLTACAQPGDGKVGDACPCEYGTVCSQATQTCVKLCNVSAPSDCATEADDPQTPTRPGRCQASAALPQGFGVCAGQ
ncbi:MAG TPA: hypothetical protein VER33_26915 [Polyangiaceae bacterium]|nr:hypothetical protein [Polyangiaceae bacterium]